MNGKKVKQLKEMAAMFYQLQPINMPNRKTLEQVYKDLKTIHKSKKSK